MSLIVLIRGGGDLASGVALRLRRAGIRVLITELPQPMAVRRLVSFAEAVYQGEMQVEEVVARRTGKLADALDLISEGVLPVLVDVDGSALPALRANQAAQAQPLVLVDGRMTKRDPGTTLESADLVIGLGPGFVAGKNCHTVIETNRGHYLGRVIWQGPPEADTGVPESVTRYGAERVLRAPADGVFEPRVAICDHLQAGQVVAEVDGQPLIAPFGGVLRGILHSGIYVQRGLKVGDVDPRDDPRYCTLVSDKSLAVGAGVLEAILARPELRPFLWE